MDYKKEIERLVGIAESHGLTKRQISTRLGRKPAYITEGLSKGGNEDMYNQLNLLVQTLGIAKSNDTVPMGKYVEMLEKSVGSSLENIQTMQKVLLQTMATNHDVVVAFLSSIKEDTKAVASRK